MINPFEDHLERNAANYQALSPLSFLPRTAAVHPDRIALVHGDLEITWAEAYRRCRQLADHRWKSRLPAVTMTHDPGLHHHRLPCRDPCRRQGVRVPLCAISAGGFFAILLAPPFLGMQRKGMPGAVALTVMFLGLEDARQTIEAAPRL